MDKPPHRGGSGEYRTSDGIRQC